MRLYEIDIAPETSRRIRVTLEANPPKLFQGDWSMPVSLYHELGTGKGNGFWKFQKEGVGKDNFYLWLLEDEDNSPLDAMLSWRRDPFFTAPRSALAALMCNYSNHRLAIGGSGTGVGFRMRETLSWNVAYSIGLRPMVID